jgi:chemotaxis protein methyltransferase CheR
VKPVIDEIVRRSGMRMASGTEERLQRHIHTRMRTLGLSHPEDLLACLEPGSPLRAKEIQLLAQVLTTGETFFMRDRGQMELLRETCLPDLLARRRRQGRFQLKLWSSACSTGEEAYSLAILLHELVPDRSVWQIELYGTDVNRDALQRAQAGVYGAWAFRGCDPAFQQRYFHQDGSHWVLKSHIRHMVRFQPSDLLHDILPHTACGLADMDLILCRNLFIYLQPEAIDTVTEKLAACLCEGGLLMTGHGELSTHRHPQLHPEVHSQSIVYRKRPLLEMAAANAGPATMIPAVSWPRPMPSRTTRKTKPLPVHKSPPAVGRGLSAHLPKDGAGSDQLALAWRLADAGRLHEAQVLCRRLQTAGAMTAELHFLTAVVAMELGETPAARESLRKALYLDPDMIAAHVHLERLQSAADERQAAGKTRETIVRLLKGVPPDGPVPFLGETSASELIASWERSPSMRKSNT